MKVFVITTSPYPHGLAESKRIGCYVKALAEAGIPSSVYVYGPAGRRLWKSGLTRLQTLLTMIDVCLKLLVNVRRADVVYCYSNEHPRFVALQHRIAHLKGARFFMELCEFPYVGNSPAVATPKFRILTEKVMPECDGFIVISDALAEWVKPYCRPECRIVKIPILVDYDTFSLTDSSCSEPVPFILHAGRLYEMKDGFLGMLEAFGIMVSNTDKDVRFLFTGRLEGSRHEKEARAIMEKYRLEDKVRFLGYVTDGQLSDYLSRSAMCIINKYPNKQNQYCFSTKLGEYMAAGKAVIITRVGEATNWLTDGLDALIVEPGDARVLASAMQRVLEDEDARRRLGANARKNCRKFFDYRVYSQTLKEAFS